MHLQICFNRYYIDTSECICFKLNLFIYPSFADDSYESLFAVEPIRQPYPNYHFQIHIAKYSINTIHMYMHATCVYIAQKSSNIIIYKYQIN